jgi:predicted DNA-binding transcriptional regulator YafY
VWREAAITQAAVHWILGCAFVRNPLWALGLSGDGVTKLLGFWQKIVPETGALVHDFTDPTWNTRFLGDLYQDLSEAARKKYALLQTPEFVEKFLLDRTLTPAVPEFGYRVVRLLDPTCGSGHFLLGGEGKGGDDSLPDVFVRQSVTCVPFRNPLLPAPLREEVGEAIAKTTALLPKMDKVELATALAGRVQGKGSIDYTEKQVFLETLLVAMAEGRVCRVTYRSPAQERAKTYGIAPRQLLAHHGTLYVRASYVPEGGRPDPEWDDMVLALHRVEDLGLTDEAFELRPAGEGGDSPHFGFMDGEPFRARVRFSGWAATHVRERTWSRDQEVAEEPGGSVVLALTATSRPELVSWVLGFGPHAEVLEPADLRGEVAEALREALAVYVARSRPESR